MSEQRLEYKGYQGSVEVSLEDDVLHGKILRITDLVTFEAKTPDGLQQAFKQEVDEYLAFVVREKAMSDITFEFATHDDCLDKMVPSDLRGLVGERDRLIERNRELESQAESAPAPETGSVPNLTRLKARWQDEALHEAICVLESEFDPTHPIIERLEGLEQEMRCRAEEK